MDLNMKAILNKATLQEEEDWFIQMERCTRVSGYSIKLMGSEPTSTRMVLLMKDFGKKTFNKEKELRDGQTDRTYSFEIC
jgi:hypothetical protein